MRAFFSGVMILWAAQALAQSAEILPEEPSMSFDTIYNVPEVQRVALDPATGSLFAAVSPVSGSADGVTDIVWWSLDPIRLMRTWSTDTLVSDLAISETGLVYAAGQRGGALLTKGSSAPRSGSVIGVDPNMATSEPIAIVKYEDPEGRVTISRFNQVAFDGKGWIYLAAPTQFSVAALPDSLQPLPPATTLPQFLLQCGAPAQLSLFDLNGQVAFAASTVDGALLETGVVESDPEAPRPAQAGCFRVTNTYEHKEPPPTLNSVVHAVLADAGGRADAVLALEPNTGLLHLLGLDPKQQLSRAGLADLQARPGELTILSSSADGAIIFVGGQGKDEVLRFRRDGDALVRVGTLLTGPGLKQIEVSPDGTLAVMVLKDRSGQDRIHLIRNPGLMEEGGQTLAQAGETLRQLQSKLNALGYSVGPPDGILGPRTMRAIEQLELQQRSNSESPDFVLELLIRGVMLTRPLGEQQN